MPFLLRKQILRLVVHQVALGEHLKLHSELVDVFDGVAGEPLPGGHVLEQNGFVADLVPHRIEALLGVYLLDEPDGAGGEVGGD